MHSRPTYRILLLHALAWTAFIVYEMSMALVLNPTSNQWWEYASYYLVNISLFYLNAHVVLHYVLERSQRPLLLLVLIPFELLLYTLVEYGLEHLLNVFRAVPKPIFVDSFFVLKYIWRGVYFLGFSTAYWFFLHTLANNRRINLLQVQRLEAEKARSELERNLVRSQNAFLQAQISPHLLFNTLNFIYNAVQDVSEKASHGVLLLSEVMHYALTRVHEDGKTDLSSEVEHIKKYVALNQLRFSYPLYLNMHYNGPFRQHRIPPLILLTFVENTFKHGDLTDASLPAAIHIGSHDCRLEFSSVNKKKRHLNGRGYGIGIQNAETRLRDFYGEQGFTLHIKEDEQLYTLTLKIDMTQ
ncbi:sensor histidine kinase [Pontibacter sp. SGAir0037]|uniref:sensor histidine kinase n=1 Tax=Pontibacter sp. SGAir0037 TaxID=2571030 RepID=UPI0010CD64EF|nr:histidine kinase [Pontibacter sp. SGAir0037]QCR22334.1 hypothetical protein C1N53_08285 [Pontibacter sp. SGAir0037]